MLWVRTTDIYVTSFSSISHCNNNLKVKLKKDKGPKKKFALEKANIIVFSHSFYIIHLCPKQDLNPGSSRIAIFYECKATALTNQPPRLNNINRSWLFAYLIFCLQMNNWGDDEPIIFILFDCFICNTCCTVCLHFVYSVFLLKKNWQPIFAFF